MKSDRLDSGKLDLTFVSSIWIILLAEAMHKANILKGYSKGNWFQSVNTDSHDDWVERCFKSLERHLTRRKLGQMVDEELNTLHMILAALNCLFIATYDFFRMMPNPSFFADEMLDIINGETLPKKKED